MPLRELKTYRWRHDGRDEAIVTTPSWEAVDAAIRQLDGAERNDLYLRAGDSDDGPSLGIGGGAGRYVIVGFDGDESPTWVNPAATSELVPIFVGGQLGEYPMRNVATLGEALTAAYAFYSAGSLDCGINWSRGE